MSTNYSKGVPVGNNQVPHFLSPPAIKAIAATMKDASAATSSILVLTQDTTAIEVSPSGGPAYIRWLTQSVVDSSVAGTSVITTGATANFDNVIPNATVIRYIVPIATIPNSYSSFQGANRQNGLYTHVAYSGIAVTSMISINQYGSSNSY